MIDLGLPVEKKGGEGGYIFCHSSETKRRVKKEKKEEGKGVFVQETSG